MTTSSAYADYWNRTAQDPVRFAANGPMQVGKKLSKVELNVNDSRLRVFPNFHDCPFNSNFRLIIFMRIFLISLLEPFSGPILVLLGQRLLFRNGKLDSLQGTILNLVWVSALGLYIYDFSSLGSSILLSQQIFFMVFNVLQFKTMVSSKHAHRSDYMTRMYREQEWPERFAQNEQVLTGWNSPSRVDVALSVLEAIRSSGCDPYMPLIFVDHGPGATGYALL
jgi:hypothetical protein